MKKTESDKDIAKYYSLGLLSITEIADKYGVSSSTVNRASIREKIVRSRITGPRNKIALDENFFILLNSEEKAYWAGFILADGSLSKTKGGSFELRIKLSIRDLKHLNLFKKSINSEHKIKRGVEFNKRTKKYYKFCSISIVRKKVIRALAINGIYVDKSSRVKIPPLSNENMRHFLRGLFDGDGGWCFRRGTLSFSIRSSCPGFLERVQKILIKECNLHKNKIFFNNGAYKLGYEGNKSSLSFYNYIYKDCKISLRRKKVFATSHLDKYCEK